MTDRDDDQSLEAAYDRARTRYWRELVQLKIESEYLQRYRHRLGRILTWFEIARAVVSVGALGSWVAGLGFPKLWAAIIVVSQVAEAVMTRLPLTNRLKGVAAFGGAVDAMLIDALLEWEEVETGSGSAQDINRRWHTLMRLRHEAEAKHLPEGLPFERTLYNMAEQVAAAYIKQNYGAEVQ